MVQLLVMTLFVLLFAELLKLLIGVFKATSRRVKTVHTLLISLIRYMAAAVILCWGLSILGVDVSPFWPAWGCWR